MAGSKASTSTAALATGGTGRDPITERGTELLALVANSTDPAPGVMYLTQAEGSDAVQAGFLVVDMTNTSGDMAAVSLTDAGTATLASTTGQGTDAVTSGTVSGTRFEIDDDVPMPTDKVRRGRSAGYPFDALNVGQSFHVPLGEDDKKGEDTVIRLTSSVSGARAKFAVPDGDKVQTVKVRTYKRDEAGNIVKGADGKRVVESEKDEQRPVMKFVRDFTAVAVGAEDKRGSGARVFRMPDVAA